MRGVRDLGHSTRYKVKYEVSVEFSSSQTSLLRAGGPPLPPPSYEPRDMLSHLDIEGEERSDRRGDCLLRVWWGELTRSFQGGKGPQPWGGKKPLLFAF